MSVPEWFLALAQKHLSLAPIRVGLALFQAGTRTVDTGGNPIIHGQLSLSQLQRLTHLSRPAVINGLQDLEELAGLVRHESHRARAPWGYALPLVKIVDRDALVKIIDQMEAGTGKESRPHGSSGEEEEGVGGGGEGGSTVLNNQDPPTPPPPRGLLGGGLTGEQSRPVTQDQAELLADLTELGVGDPQEFLEKFPRERVQAWVAWIQQQPQGRFKNPAGFIFRKLEEGKEPPVPDRVRQFTRGKYGHAYRH